MARARFPRRHSPATAAWWGRLFVALLFAFHVNFVPIHLAVETHLHDSLASVEDAAFHHHGQDDSHHHHGSDHHTPHPASDHSLILTATAKIPTALDLLVPFLPADTSMLLSEPEAAPPIPIFERERPPGESPPDPLQPRAPPLA